MTSTQEPQDSLANPKPRPRRRKWLWAAPPILIVLLAAGLTVIWFGGSGDRAIAQAKAEAKARGYATSLGELYAQRKSVDDEANAALVYEKAAIALDVAGGEDPVADGAPDGRYIPLVSNSRSLYHVRSTDAQGVQARKDVEQVTSAPRTPMPDYILAASKYYLDKRSEAVALIGKARALPESRYDNAFLSATIRDENGKAYAPDNPSRYLRVSRQFMRLMALAAWVDAEEGRTADAVAKVRDDLAIARSIAGDPCLGSLLTSMALTTVTAKMALPRVLARTNPSNADLAALENDMRRLAEEFSVKRGIQGEITRILDAYNKVESAKIPIREVYRPSDYLRLSNDPVVASLVDRNLSAVLSGFYKRDIAILVRYYIWVLDHIDDGPSDFADVPDPLLAEIQNGRYVIAQGMLGVISRIPIQAALTAGTLDTAATALAACRYRNDHGAWSESLDALVPAYIDKVPLDPFTGKPLVYKIEEAGIAVYSVGANGVDDGGKGFLPGSDATQGDDNGMRVWK